MGRTFLNFNNTIRNQRMLHCLESTKKTWRLSGSRSCKSGISAGKNEAVPIHSAYVRKQSNFLNDGKREMMSL